MISRRSLIAASSGLLLPSLARAQDDAESGNPFVYPAGRAPGFDQTHPASQNFLFAVYPITSGSNGVFINSYGVIGASTVATFGAIIDSTIGPALRANPADGGNNAQSFTVTLPAGGQVTTAAIFRSGPSGANSHTITGAGAGASLTTSSVLVLTPLGHASNFTLVNAGVYFVAASQISGTGNCNIVLVNLRTGQTFTQVIANAIAIAGVTTIFIGNTSGANAAFTGFIGPIAVSTVYLSLSQLLAWAADPWAFWYPRTPLSYGGMSQ